MGNKLTSHLWQEYALIDSGNQFKLERFGNTYLKRPEPQAVWQPKLSDSKWAELASASFQRKKTNEEDGNWQVKNGVKDRWVINYKSANLNLNFRLGLTSFKHVGLFPEQAENWEFIYAQVKKCKSENPKVLNLFAYTGGASLAAKAAGADVVHVDSIKPVVTWAKENMELSGLDGIRWVVEDAMKFVKREVKRGTKYSGIILDPPAYGRGPDGEKWIMEDKINEMMACCAQLLLPNDSFLVLNLYSMGLSSLIADSLVESHFTEIKEKEFGELYFADEANRNLPLGTYFRFIR
ncbi:MAG: class I SAM-dependent methyltransferase [Bacteroidetes bacterium]|nr:class I SAM-dependent methyltransferase [Bacteroidota bacterium]MBK9355513.1 class I SAM-dependent methyltransferase [Bacteroidota bacterium]